MRRSIAMFVAVVALAGCSELPTESTLTTVSPDGAAAARAGGYRNVLLKPGMPDAAVEAGAPVVSSLADAVSRVAPGGTIRVFAGTYAAEMVVIEKPVTIVGKGNGPAIFRTETGPYGIEVGTGGSLTLSGLEFENASPELQGASVAATGTGVQMVVDGVAFRGEPGAFSTLYHRNQSAGGSLTVTDSRFEGGGYGLIGLVESAEIRGNHLEGQDWVSFYFTGAATVEGNTMTECGNNACIYAVANASGTIAGNALSNGLTGPGPVDEGAGSPIPGYAFDHHVIWVSSPAGVAITGNEIDGCGWGQCITLGLGGTATIEDNVITAYESQGTRIGIVAGDAAGGSSGDPAAAGHAVVRNNTLIGVSANTDRDDLNRYAFRIAGLLAEGTGATLVAEGNTVTNAGRGLLARAGGSITGSGNALSLLHTATAIFDGGTVMDVHGSNFTDYIHAIHQVANISSSLTCNWWGDAAGPSGVLMDGGQGPSLYTPWATATIAATDETTGCTGAGPGTPF